MKKALDQSTTPGQYGSYIQTSLDNECHRAILMNIKPLNKALMPALYDLRRMKAYPESPRAIERYLMTSITVALLTILIFGASERGVISFYTKKWNETEMNAAIYIMMAFVALCVIRGIYLLIKSKMNGLLYIMGVPLGLLTLLELGTVFE